MTVNRFDQGADQLGPALGSHGQMDGAGGLPLQASGWAEQGSADPGIDPVEAYFECITTCSLDDGDCVTTCTEILRQSS